MWVHYTAETNKTEAKKWTENIQDKIYELKLRQKRTNNNRWSGLMWFHRIIAQQKKNNRFVAAILYDLNNSKNIRRGIIGIGAMIEIVRPSMWACVILMSWKWFAGKWIKCSHKENGICNQWLFVQMENNASASSIVSNLSAEFPTNGDLIGVGFAQYYAL